LVKGTQDLFYEDVRDGDTGVTSVEKSSQNTQRIVTYREPIDGQFILNLMVDDIVIDYFLFGG
jgi:hypothetical protein